MATMQALVRDRYGSPDVLRLDEVERPETADDGALVRVRAVSVNRGDWYTLAGAPALMRPMMGGVRRPKSRLVGGDFAGTVEAVGKDVADLGPGDEVFGVARGSFAEYVCARQGVVRKPANLSFEEAATLPVAGLTALQAIRDKAQVRAGQHVLVNGASGGVGTFAVQIAKGFGAEVTAVCSPRNVELVRSLGADHVIDYTQEDFSRGSVRYDAMLDVAGRTSFRASCRVLAPKAPVVVIGAPATTPLLGPLGHIGASLLAAVGSGHKAVFFVAKVTKPDLDVLRELAEAGTVRPVIDRTYALADAPDALRAMGEGHVQGKLVITV